MRKIFKAFLGMMPLIPWALQKSVKTDDEEREESDIETTINKIFLTSLQSQFSNLKLFALNSQMLGRQVSSHLDIGLGRLVSNTFSDGETNIQVMETVRGYHTYVIKSFKDRDINNGLIELLLTVSCLKKQGAERVTVIAPFFPYSSTFHAGSKELVEGMDFYTCFAADIVKMLESLGCDEIITMNSSLSSPKGFGLNSNFVNIRASELVVPYLLHRKINDPVIVGMKSHKKYIRSVSQIAKSLKLFEHDCQIGFFNGDDYMGEDVDGRDVLLYSNVMRSGQTLKRVSQILKKKGASNIYCFSFHGLSTNQQIEKMIQEAPIKELIMTNSSQHSQENKRIRTISISKLIAEIITIIHQGKSLASFRQQRQMLHYAFLQKMKIINKSKKLESPWRIYY